MENVFITSFETSLPWGVIALRLGAACALGIAIGIDREVRDRPAGLRTHMLTALAAAMFAIIAIEMMASLAGEDRHTQFDPIRVVEAVTAGVAFLAAGTIIQARGSVKGLTTGAGMWLAGAVGLACGAGYLTVAVIGAVFAIVILLPFRIIESRLLGKRRILDREEPDNDV
ncbi:MgtC/SapB family protein [Hyphomonas oceanitis]|uniref:MgtC/SapB family protein n=1 Tax=Hyphomonas oceanitis TaxID=81033 RepID=UPI003002E443